ncbi:TPA: hypothetical protein HA317_01550 [Candidatus Woesearchaeota archaeon]|nr:hypothetical protein [Candidatus Woesearchaeota archaeon]
MANTDIIGYCVCTRCGFSMPAPKGVDCSMVRCPKCGGMMRPGGMVEDRLEI